MASTDSRRSLCLRLFEVDGIKIATPETGPFVLKSGLKSPIYVDLRVIVSYPELLQSVARAMWECMQGKAKFDLMCGVPYTAMPIATVMAIENKIPMLMRRKEVKKYGTKKIIEGAFKAGQTCLVVEDLVTSAMSCFETIGPLKDQKLEVHDVVVLLDREQGGETNLKNGGINLHSVFKLSEVLDILEAAGKIQPSMSKDVKDFIRNNQVVKSVAPAVPSLRSLTFEERAEMCPNAVAARLFKLMAEKKSNLCASADLTTAKEVLALVDAVGPHICMLKTHVDILTDFTPDFLEKLQAAAKKHNFIIFEDRKFADIGNTVKNQYSKGMYQISNWSDITNAHILSGPGIITGMKEAIAGRQDRGLLLLAQMSSKDNLLDKRFETKALEWADQHKDFVMGFISMGAISEKHPHLIHMTPGVNLAAKGDQLGQQYKTPDHVIGERLSDVLIVGRGIYRAEDPAKAAQLYRNAGWEAYMKRIKN